MFTILQGFFATVLRLMVTTTQAAASSNYTLPIEVTDGLQTIQFTCLAIAGFLASLCLIISGILKMLGLQERMKNWNTNILIGLVQVMTAPAVCICINTDNSYYFTVMVFNWLK